MKMSDLHHLPLVGHDLPEIFPRERERAHVYWAKDGWYWEHSCAPGWWKDSGFPYAARQGAIEGALWHLRGCCA